MAGTARQGSDSHATADSTTEFFCLERAVRRRQGEKIGPAGMPSCSFGN